MTEPLLTVEGLSKTYRRRARGLSRARDLTAVNDVSFTVGRGESVGLVGESGCGKSTIARCILRLIDPTAGRVVLDGSDLTAMGKGELRRIRRRMQIVFQDPFASLDPRMTVQAIVEEPLIIHGMGDAAARRAKAIETLDMVGIGGDQLGRRPHAFSGGQRQRISLARALVLEPELVVLDEPVSALDVSIQAQVLNLLKDLQRRLNLTYVFIAHDLAVAEYFCDRVAVLYLGEIMEMGRTSDLFREPMNPYTVSLLSAVPVPDPDAARIGSRVVLTGEVGADGAPSQGCPFQSRCPIGKDREICGQVRPPLQEAALGHAVACHFPGEFTFAAPTAA
jgi:oligopeptide transport system ATP-binding protein